MIFEEVVSFVLFGILTKLACQYKRSIETAEKVVKTVKKAFK